MKQENWLKIDENIDFLKIKLDMEILKRRWPGRYIYLIEKKLHPSQAYVLYIKHNENNTQKG